MLQKERQDQLLKILQERRYASIGELAGEIFVSTATIRRDLKILEQQGLVHLSYGGVSLSQSGRKNVPLPLRQAEHVAIKQRIAQQAAALIQPHDAIIMDGSSTVQHIAELLSPEMDLTIFTYCVDTAALLARKNIPVHCLGGVYQLHSAVTTGYFAEKNAEMITADLCFLSSQGLNRETGLITEQMSSSEVHDTFKFYLDAWYEATGWAVSAPIGQLTWDGGEYAVTPWMVLRVVERP